MSPRESAFARFDKRQSIPSKFILVRVVNFAALNARERQGEKIAKKRQFAQGRPVQSGRKAYLKRNMRMPSKGV
ncbi:hypothetical protein PPGU16_47090 [Paraburkholderia largidicola]|uniref:Uncharacterized protein n=1 Tax=Paraburkholderia largidicola TaxID=3014751 RepID=A0A7I8BSI6_9BURK|nr:hypothetical protein PPGU16_47090 [Paraburkholderia sp. PGU16]